MSSVLQRELPAVIQSLGRLQQIQTTLADSERGEFVGKDVIVRMIIVCAIAQEPMVIFGTPGTAKSAVISRFCDLLGLERKDYFRYLLTSFTEPDELLGVVDIEEYMENKRYRRIESGGIRRARVVFLDEVFRGNSAILNTLLSIINERVYYEGGEAIPVETQVVYGATNDAPTSSDLAAFYARFPIRLLSHSVLDSSVELGAALLEKGWGLEVRQMERRALSPEERVEFQTTSICEPGDLERCQRWLRTNWHPASVHWADKNSSLHLIKRAFLEIVRQLNTLPDQFQIDDRKAIKLFKVLLAYTMLRGGAQAAPTLTDVWAILQHSWQDPQTSHLSLEHITRVTSQVDRRYRSDFQLPEHAAFHLPGRAL